MLLVVKSVAPAITMNAYTGFSAFVTFVTEGVIDGVAYIVDKIDNWQEKG